MPKAGEKFEIRIDSILGGHAPTTHFAAADQFRASYGIDPSTPIDGTTGSIYGIRASGLLTPTMAKTLNGTTQKLPLYISGARGSTTVYIYDAQGSAYTRLEGSSSYTAMSDDGALTNGGHGMTYYDNYMYFATATDITRFGPLNGATGFVKNYWTSGLSLTALTNIKYPYHTCGSGVWTNLPQHYLHRHSDGRLYIADVVDNKGTIHYIETTKTTIEGDTNNGSTYNILQVGYGLIPICMESYGSDLAIAFYERDGTSASGFHTCRSKTTRAKIAFWDTTSAKVNKITWVEYPDSLITAMKNVNGVLYVFSTIADFSTGFRVTRFIGGYTFEEVWSAEDGLSPWPGAIDGTSDRLLFGSQVLIPETRACVFSLGLNKGGLSNGIFIPFAAPVSDNVSITALTLSGEGTVPSLYKDYPMIGWSNAAATHGLGSYLVGNISAKSMWWSQTYRIGQPFKITKIRIPLGKKVAADMTIIPKIYTDDGVGTIYTLTTINNTNYSNSELNIVQRNDSSGNPILGQHNFWLELAWSGSEQVAVNLPISIEGEYIDD